MMYLLEGTKRFFSKQKRLKSYVQKFEVLNSNLLSDKNQYFNDKRASLYNIERINNSQIDFQEAIDDHRLTEENEFSIDINGQDDYFKSKSSTKISLPLSLKASNAGDRSSDKNSFYNSSIQRLSKGKINKMMDAKIQKLDEAEAEEDDTIHQVEEEGQNTIEAPLLKVQHEQEIEPVRELSQEDGTFDTSYLSIPAGRNLVFNTANMKVDPLNILCMNIPAYMGGVVDMWNHSKEEAPFNEIGHPDRVKKFTLDQNIDDGILEFLGFTSKIKFGMLERVCRGWGKRLCQGKLISNFTAKFLTRKQTMGHFASHLRRTSTTRVNQCIPTSKSTESS